MKVKPTKKINNTLLDDFFKGDENYIGNVEDDESCDTRSYCDKHWDECRQISQYAEEIEQLKAEVKKLNKENSILSVNADTAFQDGLNEAQDLYAEQIRNEVRAEAIKEFAKNLKAGMRDLAKVKYNGNTL